MRGHFAKANVLPKSKLAEFRVGEDAVHVYFETGQRLWLRGVEFTQAAGVYRLHRRQIPLKLALTEEEQEQQKKYLLSLQEQIASKHKETLVFGEPKATSCASPRKLL